MTAHSAQRNALLRRAKVGLATAVVGFGLGVCGWQFTSSATVDRTQIDRAAESVAESSRTANRLTTASAELQAARQSATRAESNRSSWLSAHFSNWLQEAATLDATASTNSKRSAPANQFDLNPEWADLDRQIHSMGQRRADLLETYTSEHPDIVKLDADLQSLRARLLSTPQYVSSDDEAPAPAAPQDVSNAQELLVAQRLQRRRDAMASYSTLEENAQLAHATAANLQLAQLQLAQEAVQGTSSAAAELAELVLNQEDATTAVPWGMLLLVATGTGLAAGCMTPVARSVADPVVEQHDIAPQHGPVRVAPRHTLPIVGVIRPVHDSGLRIAQ